MKDTFKHWLHALFRRMGYQLMRIRPEDRPLMLGYDPEPPLPHNAARELRPDNPRLRALESRYAGFESPVSIHTYWKGELQSDETDLRYFRGETAYVWQYYSEGSFVKPFQLLRLQYYPYVQYIRALDHRQLLGPILNEDGAFGCHRFTYPGLDAAVSRDLLDAINEIYFLDRHWQLFERTEVRILDLGAGYGRLAHRMLSAVPNIAHYACTDAVPRSTFLCEYYLRERGLLDDVGGKASVIPLDETPQRPARGEIDLAINIHSFSEMCLAAVQTWAEWLAGLGIRHLFVVPNEEAMLTREVNGDRLEYLPALNSAGYKVIAKQPTITDPMVRELFGVKDFFLLMELQAS